MNCDSKLSSEHGIIQRHRKRPVIQPLDFNWASKEINLRESGGLLSPGQLLANGFAPLDEGR
jgi:hypothetical protein